MDGMAYDLALCFGLVASTYQRRYQFWDRFHFVIMFFGRCILKPQILGTRNLGSLKNQWPKKETRAPVSDAFRCEHSPKKCPESCLVDDCFDDQLCFPGSRTKIKQTNRSNRFSGSSEQQKQHQFKVWKVFRSRNKIKSRVQTWRHFTQFCWLEIMTSKMIC